MLCPNCGKDSYTSGMYTGVEVCACGYLLLEDKLCEDKDCGNCDYKTRCDLSLHERSNQAE